MDAKEFFEYQLNDKTSVVGRQDKDEIIMLMEEYHKYRVKNCSIPAVNNNEVEVCFVPKHIECIFRNKRNECTSLGDVSGSLPDEFGHHNNWKYCPGCGKNWEKDSESFGCWSCGFVTLGE